MKFTKLTIIFIFILAFAVSISAQKTQTISSLQEVEFLEQGKIKGLQFTISTKEDVKKTFGESCETNCVYERNWEVFFNYFKDEWIRKTTFGDKELVYKPKIEFFGKLSGAIFYPKTRILLAETAEIPEEFECVNYVFISADKIKSKARMCIKNKKVIYAFYNKTMEDRKISKGQLIFVQFALSKKDSDKVSVLVEN